MTEALLTGSTRFVIQQFFFRLTPLMDSTTKRVFIFPKQFKTPPFWIPQPLLRNILPLFITHFSLTIKNYFLWVLYGKSMSVFCGLRLIMSYHCESDICSAQLTGSFDWGVIERRIKLVNFWFLLIWKFSLNEQFVVQILFHLHFHSTVSH